MEGLKRGEGQPEMRRFRRSHLLPLEGDRRCRDDATKARQKTIAEMRAVVETTSLMPSSPGRTVGVVTLKTKHGTTIKLKSFQPSIGPCVRRSIHIGITL